MSLRISSCISGVWAAGAASACAGPPLVGRDAGRSELNGTTTTVRRSTLSLLPWPDIIGSLTTGIMLSDPAGT